MFSHIAIKSIGKHLSELSETLSIEPYSVWKKLGILRPKLSFIKKIFQMLSAISFLSNFTKTIYFFSFSYKKTVYWKKSLYYPFFYIRSWTSAFRSMKGIKNLFARKALWQAHWQRIYFLFSASYKNKQKESFIVWHSSPNAVSFVTHISHSFCCMTNSCEELECFNTSL